MCRCVSPKKGCLRGSKWSQRGRHSVRSNGSAPGVMVHGGAVVGETTSGAWGYRVGHSMALGMLRADLAVAGTEVEVEIFGERVKAVVLADGPAWDAKNVRIRA